MGTAESVTGTAGSAVDSASESVQSQIQGSPLAAGAAAAALGFIIAAAIPPSDKEKQLAEPMLEKAQPLVDEAKSPAQDVAIT